MSDAAEFQQAKKPDSQPQFLQIVAKPSRVVRKVEAKPEPKLTRVAFAVSRLMEFCSKRELQNQTGHSVYDWPLVVAKELFDNALDACEEAEVAPDITVIVEQDRIIVQDNANGIDAKTIESILDYTIRVSSREAYVSPTRGAQGNALKTILAMGYVLQGAAGDAAGVTIIETRGVAHRIEFRADHINNQPKIIHTTTPVADRHRNQVHDPLARAGPLGSGPVQAARQGVCLVQSAPHGARGLVRSRVHQRDGDQSQLGKMAAAQPDQRPLVRRSRGCSVISPRMWPETAISARAARCASSSPNFAGSPGPRFSARSSTKSAARINRWRASSAPIRSTAPALPSCWKRCSGTASRSPRSILASSAPGTSKSGS